MSPSQNAYNTRLFSDKTAFQQKYSAIDEGALQKACPVFNLVDPDPAFQETSPHNWTQIAREYISANDGGSKRSKIPKKLQTENDVRKAAKHGLVPAVVETLQRVVPGTVTPKVQKTKGWMYTRFVYEGNDRQDFQNDCYHDTDSEDGGGGDDDDGEDGVSVAALLVKAPSQLAYTDFKDAMVSESSKNVVQNAENSKNGTFLHGNAPLISRQANIIYAEHGPADFVVFDGLSMLTLDYDTVEIDEETPKLAQTSWFTEKDAANGETFATVLLGVLVHGCKKHGFV